MKLAAAMFVLGQHCWCFSLRGFNTFVPVHLKTQLEYPDALGRYKPKVVVLVLRQLNTTRVMSERFRFALTHMPLYQSDKNLL